MNIVLITCGLPGPAYHGGAVTCWAISKALRARGHRVTILSLFDTSALNPYIESKERQLKALTDIGIDVEFVYYDYQKLNWHKRYNSLKETITKIAKDLLKPQLESFFPWSALNSQVRVLIRKIKPDVIFCYHFDSLSAAFTIDEAPLVAGLGDLWHLPEFFRWKLRKASVRKLAEGLYLLSRRKSIKRFMISMLQPCARKGAFAAHYAAWLRDKGGFADTLYFRTPVHDPVGAQWREAKRQYKASNVKPKILMIGDLSGTAAKWGLQLLMKHTLPLLEKAYGLQGFIVHIVGRITSDESIKLLEAKPYIRMIGRVTCPDIEFLSSDILLVPTPITLGIRVRIITGFSYGACIIAHRANTAGIPELSHEYNALLAADGGGLAKETIRALENIELRRRLEENARKTFEQYFSETTAATYIAEEIEGAAKR